MFNGPDIRKLIKNSKFDDSLNENELNAWNAIKDVIANVLGKHRDKNIRQKVDHLMNMFEKLAVNMSLKVHFLHHHIDWFEHQIATESDEQGERFHQVALAMETRYRGKKLLPMLADLCWWLARDEEDNTDGEEEEVNLPPSKRLKF